MAFWPLRRWSGKQMIVTAIAAGVVGTAPASTVYICRDKDGHQSIQDRPCTPHAASRIVEVEQRALGRVESGHSGRATSGAAPKQREIDRGWTGREASRCRQYQEGKLQVHARMRAGYSISEGERLRAGLDKLNGLLTTHCGKIPQQYWIQGNASDDPPA
ncbi:hypothetical protein [uncultured Abyssibacter sp.]|uniref:hypothetical protein n=1 Tax=uncultured Abyssibacter sp. TaxID=2320202 RepID=UPI0032B2C2A7